MNVFCQSKRLNMRINSSYHTNKQKRTTDREKEKKRKECIQRIMQIYIRYNLNFVRASTSQLKGNINYGKYLAHAHLFIFMHC